jgi:farnesyl-diphosphate farnesyltransferase
MARFVARTNEQGLTLHSLEDLRDYCYTVAGIVGELLTELFLLEGSPLRTAAHALRERARAFGEALQLVNILKDADQDAKEGRRYLPAGVPRSEIFALARRDLETAEEYVDVLAAAGGPPGILEFTALPAALAWAALGAVETRGPGAKVSRPEVLRIARHVKKAVGRGEPPVAYHRRLSGNLR